MAEKNSSTSIDFKKVLKCGFGGSNPNNLEMALSLGLYGTGAVIAASKITRSRAKAGKEPIAGLIF